MLRASIPGLCAIAALSMGDARAESLEAALERTIEMRIADAILANCVGLESRRACPTCPRISR